MKTYKFYSDEKITTWERTHLSIKAKSQKEATKMAKEFFANNEVPEDNYIEHLFEVNEPMTVEENQGNATKELYKDNGQQITDNVKTK